MTDPSRVARWLLVTLIPLYILTTGLHVREIVKTGLAQPPVFAVPGPGGFPVVGGYRIESDSSGSGLEIGDRLLSVGGESLKGTGFIGFDAIVLEKVGSGHRVPLVFERDGTRRSTELVTRPRSLPWSRLPAMVLMGLACTLILLRSPGSKGAMLLVITFASYGILQAQFDGGPRWQTWISALKWNFFGPVVAVLVLRWATLFPNEVPDEERPSLLWSYLGGALYLGVRINYLTGLPLPPSWVPRLSFATNTVLLAMTLALMVANYRRADATGRRRAKWVLYGAGISAFGVALTPILQLVGPDVESFALQLGLTSLVTIAAPLGIVVAVVRASLFDVDRLISATASYSLTIVLLLAALAAGVASLSEFVAQMSGVTPRAAQLVLAAAALGLALPLSKRIRPRIDELFYPERRALESGAARLMGDLSDCHTSGEVFDLLQKRIDSLLRPELCVVLERQGEEFAPRRREDLQGLGELSLSPALPATLARHHHPWRVRERPSSRKGLEPDELDADLVGGLPAVILLPLRRGGELVAFVALGPKSSGDIYTTGDNTLLGSIAERASSELLRIRDVGILERERATASELAHLKSEAEEATLAKSRYLAAASHDLRQPLHALGLFVDGLERQIPEAAARDSVASIQQATQRLSETINALLDVSRLDAGAVRPEHRDFALAPMFDELRESFAEAAAAKTLRLRFDAAGLRAHSDAALVTRLLEQLLSNAVRFSERGEVSLLASDEGEHIEIRVADQGPGIPEEKREEVFQEFVRADDASAGLGLGLSIVDKLAARLGHPIEVDDAEGGGAVFRLRLPRAETVAAPEAPPPLARSPLAGQLLAVVDDDLEILAGMQRLLSSWECDVLLASSGDELLEAIEARGTPPRALLVDWRLADDERGPEVVARVRAASGVEVPAIVITGEADSEELAEVRSQGFVVLAKPVAPARLRATLSEMLRA